MIDVLPQLDLPRARLLACDIDGTLLAPDGRLRPAVRDAVALVAASGVHVVLATGRAPWDGIADLAAELGLDGPQITMQGAHIADPATGRIARLRQLAPAVYLDGLRFAEALGLDPVVGLLDGYRAARRAPEAEFAWTGPGSARFRLESDLRPLAHMAPVRLFLPTGPVRHRHVRAAASVWFARGASIVWSDLSGVELLGPGAEKGSAIAWLAGQMGLGANAVAAVGDAPNDATMLRYAGRAAVMGSAPDDVQRLADIVVPPSEHDGVLAALAWMFPDLAAEIAGPAPLSPPVDLAAYRRSRLATGPTADLAG